MAGPTKTRCMGGGLYCPPLIPTGIRQNPVIPEESILAEGASQIQISFHRNWALELTFRWNAHRNARMEWQPDFTGTESSEFFFSLLIITFCPNCRHIKLPSLPRHHHHPLSLTIFCNCPLMTPRKHDDYDMTEGQRGTERGQGRVY